MPPKMLFPDMRPGFGAILGMGGSCFVSVVDDKTVHKSHEIWVHGKIQSRYPENCEEDLRRELAVYEHMGPHDCILRCLGLEVIHSPPDVFALRLELAPHGTVRDLIQKVFPGDPLPEKTRLQMCRDVASGFAHVHAKGVWHSDISCRNLLVFDDYRLKICDFGGSIIQGRESEFPATVAEEMQCQLPRRGREVVSGRPRIKRELFAIGCCMYEIMAWKRPFQGEIDGEATKRYELNGEVTKRYEGEEFPSLDGIPDKVAKVITSCWNEVYDSTDEIVECLGFSFTEEFIAST
ncbi:Protein kinase-like domain protein [Niveomyces insectorum RCEF 264]|uniref:EKC/KEOPS complex subunit BUD32 n=1 Tax=Niveomyces insectorum RCEF 264 TaxID=1081102 RepID=A0A167WDG6_9HYPO|nr:Protein kinase-like domain protein [Niveomyces insectorum RCEF 264]